MPPTVSSPTSGSPASAASERPSVVARPSADDLGVPRPSSSLSDGRLDSREGGGHVAFGKYRLHFRIARGGMGEVYRASLVGELGFEKPLVIKTILPELAAQPRFIEMFAAEAKTAVALSHGNIVPIYELGRAEDTFYIVMGYVDGPSVAELLAAHRRRGHPPPLAVALSIVRGVLSGLAYAHTEEPGRPAVVHRDVTPRNVMVDRSGQVRIVDFGIASPVSATAAVRAGSTGYVAPEQARGLAVDPRADVFSTGCLLYELLTLERAFPHEGVWIPPDFARLPATLREPLERALDLDLAKRPADASGFLTALGEAIKSHAATFSEADLAAHLRTLQPDGRWAPLAVEPSQDGVTPTTAVRPTTMTFATRLTSVTAASPTDDQPTEGSTAARSPDDATAARDPDDPATTRSPDDATATGGLTEATAARSLEGGTRPASEPTATVAPPAPGRRGLVAALAVAAASLVALWLWSTGSSAPPREARATAGGEGPAAVGPSIDAAPNASPPDADPTLTPGGTTHGDSTGGLGPATSSEPEPTRETAETMPPPALVLHVEPEGATVRIGTQRFEGRSPFVLPLPTHGVLEALVEHPGHTPQTVELHAGKGGERSIVLRPVVPQRRGSLQVLAPSVSWAEVTVDGRRLGVTPTRKLELTAGDHRVVVRCVPDVCPEPRILLRRTVQIEPGQTLRLTAG